MVYENIYMPYFDNKMIFDLSTLSIPAYARKLEIRYFREKQLEHYEAHRGRIKKFLDRLGLTSVGREVKILKKTLEQLSG